MLRPLFFWQHLPYLTLALTNIIIAVNQIFPLVKMSRVRSPSLAGPLLDCTAIFVFSHPSHGARETGRRENLLPSFFVPTAGHLAAQVSHPRRSPGICQSPSQPFLGCHATQKYGFDGDYTRNLPSKAKKIIMPEVLIGHLNGYHACFKILRFLGSVPVILREFRRL